MKTTTRLLALTAALVLSAGALLAAPLAGPKGGRLLTAAAPHAEFFVNAQRQIVISFYDDALKPTAASGQVVTATAEAKAGKAKLAFTPQEGALVSTTSLPEGDGYTVVVQIRATSDAKPVNYRVVYHPETCGECNRAEYACTCEGH